MIKRVLGNTGLELSLLGFGGFHLIETAQKDATALLNTYLDRGGNYIETAPSYGDGISERKIGTAISHRRQDYFLATKSDLRTADETEKQINDSLKRLGTDYVDVLFFHHVQNAEEARQVLGSGGSLEAALKAKKEGKIRFIGVTGHGRPDGLIPFVEECEELDVLMTGFNYYDRFNFPQIENTLLTKCLTKGIGVLGMKSLGDGYLYKTPEQAIRYAMSLPLTTVVAGINRMDILEQDLAIVENFQPMMEEDKSTLFDRAEQLGNYVCRQCGACRMADFDPREMFLLEGLFDRQMDRRVIEDSGDFALRERLKHWFNQEKLAKAEYAALETQIDPGEDYSYLNMLCRHNIDIDAKLKLVHDKLTGSEFIY